MKTTSDTGHRTSDALLEIGSEELPGSFIALGMRQLKTLAEESLQASGLAYSAIDTHGTPRRLALVIHGLADRSPDQKKVVSGPPIAISKDAQGQWTPAALGFARKQGLKPSDLTIENGRLSAVVHIKGVATRQLLADLFPQWITRLEFPKSMVWEPSKFRYPRPLRWIAAMVGTDLVSFSLAGVRSARWTLGLGPWAPKKIVLTHAGKYAILLKNQCVLVDAASRQEAIRRYADLAVKRLPAGPAGVHGKVHMSASLLEQVSNLVEHPVAILGDFDSAYLDLPKEVLITCLEHHQKYFPVMASLPPSLLPKGVGAETPGEAKLLPHFIGIRNGMSVHQEIVREGYERVLAARLADARFFYNQDRKSPLKAKVEALKGVMFQDKLGNLFDKKERVKKLLEAIAPAMSLSGVLEKAKDVAELCKADLVTEMVREFPELQGIMARLYAQADGEPPDVAKALEEQYWPITLAGTLPSSGAAALVSLADKLDTLAGDFAVGLIPSGSADPYGLRRAAVGVVRILEDRKCNLPLETLIEQAVNLQPTSLIAADTKAKLAQFFRQRLSALCEERGFKADEIDSVLTDHRWGIPEILMRLQAVHDIRSKAEFVSLAAAFKRSMNIVKQSDKANPATGPAQPAIHYELLREPVEKTLFTLLDQVNTDVATSMGENDYGKALTAMVALREPLDGFFKDVMVMAEDPALRANRLALMKRLVGIFTKVADFSKLQNA